MSNLKNKLQNLSKYTKVLFYACLFYASFALTALANLNHLLISSVSYFQFNSISLAFCIYLSLFFAWEYYF